MNQPLRPSLHDNVLGMKMTKHFLPEAAVVWTGCRFSFWRFSAPKTPKTEPTLQSGRKRNAPPLRLCLNGWKCNRVTLAPITYVRDYITATHLATLHLIPQTFASPCARRFPPEGARLNGELKVRTQRRFCFQSGALLCTATAKWCEQPGTYAVTNPSARWQTETDVLKEYLSAGGARGPWRSRQSRRTLQEEESLSLKILQSSGFVRNPRQYLPSGVCCEYPVEEYIVNIMSFCGSSIQYVRKVQLHRRDVRFHCSGFQPSLAPQSGLEDPGRWKRRSSA